MLHSSRLLLVALSFLTIVPAPRNCQLSDRSLGRAVAYFPLVGALLGAFIAGVDSVCSHVLPLPVITALDLVLFAILTGGLHLDGLMDSCDGLFGGHDPEQRLAIMRDSHTGCFGMLGAALLLLLDYAALVSLHGHERAAALILAPTMGRWAIVLVLHAFPYARATGKGAAFKAGTGRREVLLASLWVLSIVAVIDPSFLWLPAVTCLVALALGRWMAALLGGLTGDSYGAVCEVVTALMLALQTARLA